MHKKLNLNFHLRTKEHHAKVKTRRKNRGTECELILFYLWARTEDKMGPYEERRPIWILDSAKPKNPTERRAEVGAKISEERARGNGGDGGGAARRGRGRRRARGASVPGTAAPPPLAAGRRLRPSPEALQVQGHLAVTASSSKLLLFFFFFFFLL